MPGTSPTARCRASRRLRERRRWEPRPPATQNRPHSRIVLKLTTYSIYLLAKVKVTPRKRIMVSESARKLAEARREFLLKHENKTPDRSQLKMYDLIYYNPVTNPMKKSKTSTVVPRQITTTPSEEVLKEEEEDNPLAMPAPQVKVGPDGQLILDEQSIVIEQTGVKKHREILSQEAIVEDDDYGGGFYKKRQKSKEWPKWETFKFYKALNVVGTDFLLMQTLFPNRTRQEIKQKYKKEERVNRALVEKTLKYHQEFDTERLEEQLASLQELENVQADANKKTSEKDKNEQHLSRSAKKRRHRLVATSIAQCEATSTNNQENKTIDNETNANDTANSGQHSQTRRGNNKRKSKKSVNDSFDDSSCLSSNSDSDSDTEIYRVRPTRSGRQPKPKKLRARSINTLDNNIENESLVNTETTLSQETPASQEVQKDLSSMPSKDSEDTATSENVATVIPDINQIEPGSLVILTKESVEEPGETILQVYMVSSNVDKKNVDDETVKSDMTPVTPPSELLSTVTNNKLNNKVGAEDAEIINVDDCE
ncbi:transcription factor TFIIIB component B'' homolog isoform X2 [Harpegnathos saltator]|uniref:transcription factor TFIIIB component B'' homolog isoform X2 n=1 Tax=Harpegnathos saltator TaxID=610380 RepID=UPI00058AF146|nr:transcription factor TFIIIB component B'' homolog isoform X2 [Harpegnathos saltator]XP_025163024.1 transcription factor TFIIIB component B'' homolog isoform X2 [Harpegnathos saltator]